MALQYVGVITFSLLLIKKEESIGSGHYTKCDWIPLGNWILIKKVEYVGSRPLH